MNVFSAMSLCGSQTGVHGARCTEGVREQNAEFLQSFNSNLNQAFVSYKQNAVSSIKTGKLECRKQSNNIKLPHLLRSELNASTQAACI